MPPEPAPHVGGELRLCGAVSGHPNQKITWGGNAQQGTVLSSNPFLSLFDVPFLMAAGAVCLGAIYK